MGFRDRGVEIKTPDQIAKMRVAGLLVGETLELLRSSVRAGVSTGELDAIAEENIRDGGGVPSFLGYGHPPFPATICASVNDEVVHGIPGDRVLRGRRRHLDRLRRDRRRLARRRRDHGRGRRGPARRTRADAGDRGLDVGRASPRPGSAAGSPTSPTPWRATSARSRTRPAASYGILEEFTGHGIGTAMHQPPNVPNYGRPGRGPKLERGLALAVEPMVTLGSKYTELAEDEWTVVTDDGSWAAHFEHTFTLTPDGAWVLTALDGGRRRSWPSSAVPYGGRG